MAEPQRRVAIVGGGFAGAAVARRLARMLPGGWDVVVYSRENHLVFTPMLAEVVGATINPLHVVWPVREMARGAVCRTAAVEELDLDGRQLVYRGAHGELERDGYDHLVLACGLPARLDVIGGMAEHGWPIKTMGDALGLRNHLIQQLERAEVETDPKRKAALLSFVVVGGGFTGIEVAGAMNDLLRRASKYYKRVDAGEIRVTVLDHGKRILAPLRESLSRFAERRMRRAGIDVRNGVGVGEVTPDGVRFGDDGYLDAGTVICAIGTGIDPLVSESGLPLEHNRIRVRPDMRVEGHDDVWALGDCAAVINAWDGSTAPTLAQFATRQAKQLARNIAAAVAGRPTRPFRYHPEGVFATIGHRSAVGVAFRVRLTGFAAWSAWHAIYLAKMPSAARRLQISVEWIMNFFVPPEIVELSTLRTDGRPPST